MGRHDYPNVDGDEEVPGDGSEETIRRICWLAGLFHWFHLWGKKQLKVRARLR
jgi:hypothetical protein